MLKRASRNCGMWMLSLRQRENTEIQYLVLQSPPIISLIFSRTIWFVDSVPRSESLVYLVYHHRVSGRGGVIGAVKPLDVGFRVVNVITNPRNYA